MVLGDHKPDCYKPKCEACEYRTSCVNYKPVVSTGIFWGIPPKWLALEPATTTVTGW